jgi:hypothetical protein
MIARFGREIVARRREGTGAAPQARQALQDHLTNQISLGFRAASWATELNDHCACSRKPLNPHAEIQVGHKPATKPTKPTTAVAAVHFAAFRFSSLTLFDCS